MNSARTPSYEVGALPMSSAIPVVFIVDADAGVRRTLEQLIATTGCEVESCATAEELLPLAPPETPACLLLDMTRPDVNRLLLSEYAAGRRDVPMIAVTGSDDVRISVQAMKAGAVDVLTKPVEPDALLSATAR